MTLEKLRKHTRLLVTALLLLLMPNDSCCFLFFFYYLYIRTSAGSKYLRTQTKDLSVVACAKEGQTLDFQSAPVKFTLLSFLRDQQVRSRRESLAQFPLFSIIALCGNTWTFPTLGTLLN